MSILTKRIAVLPAIFNDYAQCVFPGRTKVRRRRNGYAAAFNPLFPVEKSVDNV